MRSCLCSEELCILESSCSKQFVGDLHSRSVAKTKYFLFCGDSTMTSFLSPDCPKKNWKNGTYDFSSSQRDVYMFGKSWFCYQVQHSLVNHFQVMINFFLPFSATRHPFSINLSEFTNVLPCDFTRGTSHMFHCGDAAASQSLWFTFEDTNRMSLRMWQKPGSELPWMQTKHSQCLLARGERH